MGAWQEAADYFGMAIAIDPADPSAWIARAEARGSNGQLQGAISDLEHVIGAGIVREDVYVQMGYYEELLGADGEAERYYRLAYERFPSSPTPALYLGALYLRTGRGDPMPVLSRGLDLAPNHPTLNYNMALALWRRGDLSGAIGRMQQAVSPFRTAAPHQLPALRTYDSALIALYVEAGLVDDAVSEACFLMGLSLLDDSTRQQLGDYGQRLSASCESQWVSH
ncbi:MAG: tetratricopeptide repeat protein [Anaerolineae bacterium]